MNKLESLIHLLDDPDTEIYQPVAEEIVKIGTQAIDALQSTWETDDNPLIRDRIPLLIHQIQFNDVKMRLLSWQKHKDSDLLEGILAINRYGFPNLDEQEIINQLNDIKRSAWLAMRDDLSAIDQIRIINQILFIDYNFRGSSVNHSAPENSYLSSVLERNTGNQLLLSVLYLSIAQQFDLPIYGVNLPQHFILAYTDINNPTEVLFYINPFSRGEVFGRSAIDDFLVQLDIVPQDIFYLPCDNLSIIIRILRNLINSYTLINNDSKVKELQELLNLVQDDE